MDSKPEVVSIHLTCSVCKKPLTVTSGELDADGKPSVYVDPFEHPDCTKTIIRSMGRS